MVLHLIAAGLLSGPKRLTVLYADTRQELPPLALAAEEIMDELEERGVEYRVVRAPLDKRFLVYILGRGVPPPNNKTLRWCTRQIKVDPMSAEIAQLLTDGTALDRILDIQDRVNVGQRRPFELINPEEHARILELINAGTWPDGWNGDEPRADAWLEVQVFANGAEQPALFSAGDLS